MRVFLTGATGFIGGAVARQLLADGHDVVAWVRDPNRADSLRQLGAHLEIGDLSNAARIERAARGCDAAVHAAAVYRVGVQGADAADMMRSNVDGTNNAIAALIAAQIDRIVYVSTVGVFGDTGGQTVDETYQRTTEQPFLTVYEESKYAAHQLVTARIHDGARIVIVQPSGVYGPGDHSEIGKTIRRAARGQLPALPFADARFSMVHVDDVAAGILAALTRGRVGESYVLSGEETTMGDLIDRAARLGGRRPPRRLPTGVLRALAPAGRLVGPLLGTPPNLREVVSASAGVSYLASHAKAQRELDYQPRTLEQGLPSAV